jgi:hypothetical protein
VLIGLLFAGVIGWYIWNAPQPPVAVDPRVAELDNIPDLGTVTPSSRNQFERLGSNTGPFMQFADRKDPGRVAGEITANKAEPLANQRYRLEQPRAWNFLRDGRTVYVEGDSARAHFPERTSGGRPEEAMLEGNVVIKFFERREDGSRPDPQRDRPLYTARTQSLRFDGALGRIHVPGVLSVGGERGRFSGAGLTILFSEITERIELLHIDSTDFIEIIPRNPGVEESKVRPVLLPAARGSHVTIMPASFTPSRGGSYVQQPTTEPQVVEYHLTAFDDVVITQEGATLTGESFASWVRLVDNELPARTELSPARPRAASPPPTPLVADSLRPDTSTAPISESDATAPPEAGNQPSEARGPASRASDRNGPVRITFKGPLEMKPVKETPVELDFNDVFVRLTSLTERGVTAVDSASGAQAFGTLIEYGATRRDLALGAAAPMEAELRLGDKGRLRAQRVELSMTSGLARVNGAGEIEQAVPNGTLPATIEWTNSAEFSFELVRGQMTSLLRKALLIGQVRAIGSSQAGFYAEQCQADFLVHDSSSTLSRLFLSGKAMGYDGKDGMLTANSIDVKFVARREGRSLIPLRMLARGDVVASQSGNQVQTAEMDADLSTNEEGDSVVSRVQSRGGVEFQNADGVRAVSERMDADPVARIVDLSGVDARVSRGDSTINGSRIRVFGDRRRMEVPTPGSFSHLEVTEDGRVVVAHARWWQSMTFDDLAGELECRGETFAELVQGDVERNQLESEIVKIKLAPEVPASHEPDSAHADDDPSVSSGGRQVEQVEAIGDPERGRPAKAETRRYQQGLPSGTEKVLERLVYLEGMRLIADSAANTLVVPGAGKLLAVDRRPAADKADAPTAVKSPGPIDGDGARGDALFRWQGDLLMNRASGHMSMREQVRMDHRRLGNGSRIELECGELSAQLAPASAGASDSDQLEEVVAIQRVWMRTGGRELTGGELRYYAPSSTVTASGEPGQNVTLIETRSGSPFSARWLGWNLATDRFEALDTQPIIVPRR